MYGAEYSSLKTLLKQALLHGNFQPFAAACVDVSDDTKRNALVCLALARELRVYVIENRVETLQREKQEQLTSVVHNADYFRHKKLARTIITRSTPPWNEAASQYALLHELLAHWSIVLHCSVAEGNKWLAPFVRLAFQPEVMQQAFLPTMPDDNVLEVLKASEEVRIAQREGANISTYRCPNGHFYQIGDCGLPWTRSKCHSCGATIGGSWHQAQQGNVVVNTTEVTDATSAGHVLGAVNTRPANPIPERKMTSLNTTILRMLTHQIGRAHV